MLLARIVPAFLGTKLRTFECTMCIAGVSEFERLTAAVEAARLQVPIAECYPLAQAYKAHERLAEGHVVGKIVLAAHDL
jgi:NADPH:quinone reductase-like Zn-dependent oxidoreductase